MGGNIFLIRVVTTSSQIAVPRSFLERNDLFIKYTMIFALYSKIYLAKGTFVPAIFYAPFDVYGKKSLRRERD